MFEEYSGREITRVQNVFHPTETQSRRSQIFPPVKRVFEKLRFRDGLVWTEALATEIKLRFQVSPAKCERGLGNLFSC